MNATMVKKSKLSPNNLSPIHCRTVISSESVRNNGLSELVKTPHTVLQMGLKILHLFCFVFKCEFGLNLFKYPQIYFYLRRAAMHSVN